MPFDVALFDLDGVIRHFSPDRCARAAERHGVSAGDLVEAAFSRGHFDDVITGRATKTQWIERTGAAVGSHDAAIDWLSDIGTVDPHAVEVLTRVRSAGLVVALLTNGTDEVPRELAIHELRHHFDHVFNTAEIGVAKPHDGAFLHVTSTLGVEPNRVFFTDDRRDNVDAAAALGFHTHHFRSVAGLRTALTPRLGEVR